MIFSVESIDVTPSDKKTLNKNHADCVNLCNDYRAMNQIPMRYALHYTTSNLILCLIVSFRLVVTPTDTTPYGLQA